MFHPTRDIHNEKKKVPRLTFCGGVSEVTGANFLLEIGERKILVDCGMSQGGPEAREANYKPFHYDPAEIDFLFITHAHIDHIGRIPKLVKEGFKGVIYSTPFTRELALPMLTDSCGLLMKEAEKKKIPALYTMDEVHRALDLWQSIEYHKHQIITPDIAVYMRNAGHILGSAIIEFTLSGVTIAFTGDLGNTPTPLLPDTEYVTEADYMVIESVYGDRNHPELAKRRGRLLTALKEGIERGGTILIPMFSLEKTQVILHELNHFVEEGLLPRVPVYLDSPLALKVTEIYRRATKEFNVEAQQEISSGDDVFDFPGLHLVGSGHESEGLLHTRNPKIIIAGSGMSSGGRVVGHESKLLRDPQSTILFLGYQGAGTLGRQIADGLPSVTIYKEEIKVKSKVVVVEGYSSHKDSDHLIEFVAHAAPINGGKLKKVFVAMGEPKSALFLAQRLSDYLDLDAVHPQEGEMVELK